MAGRVGLVSQLERQASAGDEAPRARCGCGHMAFIRDGGENLCLRCYEGKSNTEAFQHCKALGLNSVEDMRRYCAQRARQVLRGVPSFERWANTITQATVDRIALMGGKDDKRTLERLQDVGVIDADRRIIPVDLREAARAERAGRIRAERERVEAMLKAQGVVRKPEPEVSG